MSKHICAHCGCVFDYVACDRCGCLVRTDDACYDSDDDATPYSDSCYQNLAWIHNYSYKPEPVFYVVGDRYFVVELEVDDGGEIHANAKRITDLTDGQIYCKHDGSLNDGFEVVTHPMTMNHHCTQMPWQTVANTLKEMG